MNNTLNRESTMTAFRTVANEFNNAITSDTRDDGETFYKIKDDAPEWLKGSDVSMAIHRAIDDRFPDDWVYEQMYFLAEHISDCDEADEARDKVSEWADSLVDVYNAARLKWLAMHLNNALLCDEAEEELGGGGDMFERIGAGQNLALDRIAHAMIEAIDEEANERDDDEDDDE